MSVLGHIAIGAVVARGVTGSADPPAALPRRLLALGALAMLPDSDLLLEQLAPGVTDLQHRGATHSLAVALVVAVVVGAILALRGDPAAARWALVAWLVVTCHGLVDTLGQSDLGVELWWPFSDARILAPWHILPNPSFGRPLSREFLGPLLEEAILFIPAWVYAFLPRSWLRREARGPRA